MSAETTFRAALLAHAPLVALVQQRVAANAANQTDAFPYCAFQAAHDPQRGLDGVKQVDHVTFTVECWGQTAVQAGAVGDAVEAAIDAYALVAPATVSATVLARVDGFDGELGLDGAVLTVDWWQQ